jgi:diguanylate cyclase (GGDEF)-like protein
VAERRRRALVSAGKATLVVDGDMRVRMASGEATDDVGGLTLAGAALTDAIDAGRDATHLEQAVRRAIAGEESELEVRTSAGQRSVRCAPLAGDLSPGEDLALVSLEETRQAGTELSDLRSRATDLEALVTAARRLARSSYPAEARATVCEAAREVAGADLAALLEMTTDGRSLVVAAATESELEGGTVSVERAVHAANAFVTGRAQNAARIPGSNVASAWPLGQSGSQSGTWQPVRLTEGVKAVIAVGWATRTPPPWDRLGGTMELLADEAAVSMERAAALEHLTGMARTDPLTELSNRRAWQDELSRELARAERGGQPLAIGLIDLDDLKLYNDRWGHQAGDRVLLTAAARWRRRLRLTDLLARIGGDEFALTMPGCGLAQAVELGDQLRAALPDGLSCSIGVAEWSGSESAGDLLARADQALYAAKNAGRDATFSLPTPAGPRSGRPLPSQ